MMHFNAKQGFSLIEVLIASVIVTTLATGVFSAFSAYVRFARTNADITQAALLTAEAGEILELLRDQGWDAYIEPLALGSDYHLVWNGSAYEATTTPVLLNGSYYRTVTFSSVYRDGSDVISPSGTLDPDTRSVAIEVMHAIDLDVLQESETLLHNVYEN